MNGIDVSSACHDEVMAILNRSAQPVQVEILTKDEETTDGKSSLKSDQAKDDPKSSSHSPNTANSNSTAGKPTKADKQVQTDSKWLDDLVYQHCLKCQFELNEQTKLNKISLNNKELFYSDSDDFYEVLDDSDNYAEELDDDFIDENCDAFEYKVNKRQRALFGFPV